MPRAVLVITLLLVFVSGGGRLADAGETWSADDPVVSIGGRLLDIQVQMPLEHVVTMRSTTLTVGIPRNVAGVVLVDDVSAFPMQTTMTATGAPWNGIGAIPIKLVVVVSAASDYPVRVVATPLANLTTPLAAPTTVTGAANTRIVVPMSLGP